MESSTIQIPNDVIKPIVEAKVAAAITEALGGYERLVDKAVSQILNQKVDSNGNPDRYDSSCSPTWFTWVMSECVKQAARSAIEEWFKDHQDVMKKSIAAELSKKNSPLVKQLIATLVGTVVNSDSLRYRMNVKVEGVESY